MRHLPVLFLLLSLPGSGFTQASQNSLVLQKGMEIKLKMAQTVTSKHAYVGERVELKVAEDVVSGGALLVPRNTRVLGTVNIGKAKEGDHTNPHKVVIRVDYIRLGERRIPLSGTHSDKGKVDKGTVVASTVFFGLSGLLIALDSRTGEILEGTEVKAIVNEDVSFPMPIAPSEAAPKPVADAVSS